MLSKPETTSKQSPEAETQPLTRTAGMAFAAIFYFVSGVYYLAFPILTQDLTQIHLLSIGVVSIIAGYFLLKPQKLGLWLGLLLFPVQIVTPAYGFQTEFNAAGALLTSPLDIIFLASLIVLIFFASVTFLVLLDQRRNFMPSEAKPAKK